jgi:hypothetical protein
MTYQPGTILAFSGNYFQPDYPWLTVSAGIRIRCGWPLFPALWSHVGLIVDIRAADIEDARYCAGFDAAKYDYVKAYPPGTCLLESTTMLDAPCLVTGEPISGVQCTLPVNRIDTYRGRVASMEPIRPLDEWQRSELARLALSQCRTLYDGRGVALIGTVVWKHLRSTRAADRSSYFCSELVESNLWRIGLGLPKSKPGYASPASVVQCHERFTHHPYHWEN